MCGCEEGCYYNPGSFIEFTEEATVIMLLQEAYNDMSFLHHVTTRIKTITESSMDGGGDDDNTCTLYHP